MLVFAFGWQKLPAGRTHAHGPRDVDVGSIMFTSISSSLAHSRNKGVQWDAVRNITPGILIGTFCGSFLASHVPARFLQLFFVAFLFFVMSPRCSAAKKPQTVPPPARSRRHERRGRESSAWCFEPRAASARRGTLSVPFLLWNNLDMRKGHRHHRRPSAFPSPLAGCFGYIVNGWNAANLPPYSFGYIYLPSSVRHRRRSACSPLRWVRASPRPFRSPNLRNASPSCSSSSASGCCSRRCKQTAPKRRGATPPFFYGQHPFPTPSDARRQGPEDEHGDRPESMGKGCRGTRLPVFQ